MTSNKITCVAGINVDQWDEDEIFEAIEEKNIDYGKFVRYVRDWTGDDTVPGGTMDVSGIVVENNAELIVIGLYEPNDDAIPKTFVVHEVIGGCNEDHEGTCRESCREREVELVWALTNVEHECNELTQATYMLGVS